MHQNTINYVTGSVEYESINHAQLDC